MYHGSALSLSRHPPTVHGTSATAARCQITAQHSTGGCLGLQSVRSAPNIPFSDAVGYERTPNVCHGGCRCPRKVDATATTQTNGVCVPRASLPVPRAHHSTLLFSLLRLHPGASSPALVIWSNEMAPHESFYRCLASVLASSGVSLGCCRPISRSTINHTVRH